MIIMSISVVTLFILVIIKKEGRSAYEAIKNSDYSYYNEEIVKKLKRYNPNKKQIKKIGINDMFVLTLLVMVYAYVLIAIIYDINLNNDIIILIGMGTLLLLKIRRRYIFNSIKETKS
ncbi:hypothetical protein [Clostridium frigidicarnis]|uniref:SdpI/YhfL protein family protein n=1 Tax=Clostridium frigidicarnis TaxID=84698 RepID=A0A1I0Y5C7_9CLOT|nr:hypothetical protein [Clostridium frigidicarnis]SFB08374.1 hypothetical protein SAMN04488528_101142 [Clostridium frigidicarnis]